MNARHNAICEIWCRVADQTKALVRREVLVPEFHTKKRGQAWLDTLFTGTPAGHEFFCDISVRTPCASRYQPMAQREAG